MEDRLELVLTFAPNTDDESIVIEVLTSTLEDLNEPPDIEDVVSQAIVSRWSGPIPSGSMSRLVFDVAEITADEYDRATFVKGILDRFTSDTDRITDCVRFYDRRVFRDNQQLAQEIFELEMELREAITLLTLSAGGPPIAEVVGQCVVKPKNPPNGSDLRRPHAENELFYFLFGEYVSINNLAAPTLQSILSSLTAQQDFDEFKRQVTKTAVVEDPSLEEFIASIKTLMEPIEKVRNAVAHNRAVRNKALENYHTARQRLRDILQEVLHRFA